MPVPVLAPVAAEEVEVVVRFGVPWREVWTEVAVVVELGPALVLGREDVLPIVGAFDCREAAAVVVARARVEPVLVAGVIIVVGGGEEGR